MGLPDPRRVTLLGLREVSGSRRTPTLEGTLTMADPIIAGLYRVLAVWHGRSGLPEDVYVNTFVFKDDQALGRAVSISQARNAVFEFYNNLWGGLIAPLKSYLAGRTLSGELTIKVYDLSEPPPRPPDELTYTMAGLAAGESLPSEVAVCGSYYAERNVPRQRGRIYIGPLAINAMTSPTTAPSRPFLGLRNVLKDGMQALAGRDATYPSWCVLSTVPAPAQPGGPQARVITNGWVDDAFDTQRRRGEAALGRIEW